MSLDYVFRNARLMSDPTDDVKDIAISNGKIAAIDRSITCDAPEENLKGKFVFSGYVDSHIHLDKACISSRCACRLGTLQEAIGEVARVKGSFTEEDIYTRGRHVIEMAIIHGTTRLRAHTEIDPGIGLKGFHAVQQLKRAFSWALDIAICVFHQEVLLNNPGTQELLEEALKQGADLLGGCPYTDSDPDGHVVRIFDIANAHGVALDFHLDFDLNVSGMMLGRVIDETVKRKMGGRVAVGHATKLATLPRRERMTFAHRLADAGVAVTALPATDLFLLGRDQDPLPPIGIVPVHELLDAGVLCTLATNNIQNPFTPFGDASLIRMANLYANAMRLGTEQDFLNCFSMISSAPRRLLDGDDGMLVPGQSADFIILDCDNVSQAVQGVVAPLKGVRRGHTTFERPKPIIYPRSVE
jgi:cytosine deaminase